MKRFLTQLVILFTVGTISWAQDFGIFNNAQDIGDVNEMGDVFYSSGDNSYELSASGETIGDESPVDEFYFVFNEMEGNFTIEATVFPFQAGRAGLMVRDSLDAGSPHVSFLAEQSLTLFPTFRSVPNGPTSSTDGEIATVDGNMRLAKIGNSVHLYTMGDNGDWVLLQTEIIPFDGSVYTGLAASAEDDNAYGFFGFENVELEEIPLNVTRTIQESGGDLIVTLTATSDQTVNATVTENFPAKTTVSGFQTSQGNLIENANNRQWVLSDFSGEATLTYTLTRLTDRKAIWTGTFTDGTYSGYLAGQIMYPPDIGMVERGPFTVRADIPTFIEAEWGTLDSEESLWGLFFSPLASNGVAIQAIDSTPNDHSLGLIRYTLNVQQTGQYYFFASTRAEEAQSDSIYIGFDTVEATNDFGFAMPNTKQFIRRWFEGYVEGGNFWERTGVKRPFELTAGTHELLILTREKSGKVDWFVITSNPNLDMASFELQVQTYAVSRDLPEADALPRPVPVTLDLSVVASEQPNLVIEESVMDGWTIENANASVGDVQVQGNTLTWTYDNASADATLTYEAVPREDDVFGVFNGTSRDTKNLLEKPIGGDMSIPAVIPFNPYPSPISIGVDTVFLQAERAHDHAGDVLVKPDPSLVSDLYVEAPTNGRAGSGLTGSQFSFNLNFEQTGTYYVFLNGRGESDQEDSFFIGFDDIANDGLKYGVGVPNNAQFGRVWIYVITGENFWNTSGEPRPYEINAGDHTLIVHAREPRAKLDWIAITQDPALELATLLEPGQETSVNDFMLY